MPKWLKETENSGGEWCVTDLQRDYRICHFNHQAHGGPHLHAPVGVRASESLPAQTLAEASQLVRSYAAKHREFSIATFREHVKAWKSG